MNNKYWKEVQDNVDYVTAEPFNQAFSNIANDIEELQQNLSSDNLPPLYDNTKTYSIGDKVTYYTQDGQIDNYMVEAFGVFECIKQTKGNAPAEYGYEDYWKEYSVPKAVKSIVSDNAIQDGYGNKIITTYSTKEEINKLEYYGTADIEISPISDFTFEGDTLTKYNGTDEVVVIPYKVDDTLITTIGSSAFYDNTTVKKIVIPNSITNVGFMAFTNCENLEQADLPDNCSILGSAMYQDCHSLKTVKIPKSVKELPSQFCYRCFSLKKLIIPDNITNMINGISFAECTGLETVVIPKSVLSISEDCFAQDMPSYTNPLIDTIFYIEENSYAEDWCWRNNATFRYSDIMNERYLKRVVRHATDDTKIPYFNLEKDGTLHFYKSSDFTYSDLQEISVTTATIARYANQAQYDMNDNEIAQTYAKKTTLRNLQTGMEIPLSQYDNSIIVAEGNTGGTIYLYFDLDGSFSSTYNCQINFTSGSTPTEITYTSTGIINWVGTDCKLQDGKSIFTPSANTRYNIVIYFDGNTFVGCVNGFTPATINNDGTEVS